MTSDLDPKFEKLIKKQAKHVSGNLGVNLLISRLQKKYEANQTPAELESCLQEMKAFFEKYSSVVKKDVEALNNMQGV